MKLGLNMLLWTAKVTAEHAPQLEAIKRAGADGVELPLNDSSAAECSDLGRMLDGVGLQRTATAIVPDEAHNPASPEAAHRQAGLDLLRELIDRAHAASVPLLAGPLFQPLGGFTGQGPTADERRRAADVVRAAGAHAATAGVTLALEPLNRFECHLLNTMADAEAFARLVDHPQVGVLYDTFHANIEEKDPVGCIRRHGAAIRHVHCSATDRGVPGADHTDWKAVFAALHDIGYDGWLVIESFGRALPGLAAATRIWRDLFASPYDVVNQGLPFVRKTWGA
jgi:D-psicose/D-tagatose/L-ribulose 3-epimerase